MDKWECSVCGYIYDPELGDPEHNIPAGTPFEQLPEDWGCPVCGASKDKFKTAIIRQTRQLHSQF
jgi:rubredoxin